MGLFSHSNSSFINTHLTITMKFTTTVLALASLHSANAFMVQTPRHVMQPLQSDFSYMSGNEDKSTVGTGTGTPTPFTPPKFDSITFPNSKEPVSTKDIFDEVVPVEVQGGSLRTCSFEENVDRVSVFLKTTGRPLNANVELWQGPDNAPQKMSVYLEDGDLRPFRATIESPGGSNAIAIRNTGQMEFPLTAGIDCDMSGSTAPCELLAKDKFRTVQGGAVYTTPFPPNVQSVQVALKSDGRPLNTRVELLQGPNNNKQVMEMYTEDGSERPLHIIIDTPGSGNVVRIVNTATVEFPLNASVEPYIIGAPIVEEYSDNGGLMWS